MGVDLVVAGAADAARLSGSRCHVAGCGRFAASVRGVSGRCWRWAEAAA
jgi:hypothetical protein